MDEALLKLLPIFIGFAAAYTVKKLGWIEARRGSQLLKITLYVTIPALIFVSVARLDFVSQLLIFPLLSWVVVGVTFPIVTLIARRLHLARTTEGTFRVAPLTINSGLTLPFFLTLFGGEGATRVVLFNAGFNPLLLIGVYGLAVSYNPDSKGRTDVIKRILILPPLWALVAGALVNVGNITLPVVLVGGLEIIGHATTVLVIAALGLLFNARRIRLDKTLLIVALRMGLGLLIGLVIVVLLRLQSLDRGAVLAMCAAPIGFNLLTFAAVEKLDQELAASAVSLSLLLGLISTPLILLLAS